MYTTQSAPFYLLFQKYLGVNLTHLSLPYFQKKNVLPLHETGKQVLAVELLLDRQKSR